MISLRIEVGGQTVGIAPLPEGKIVRIGRDPDSDLRIDDPAVSATHLTLEPLLSGLHKLTDENTGRPTRVNGVVVKRVSLQPGDVIEVGPARITYVVEGLVAVPAPFAPPPAAWAPPAPASAYAAPYAPAPVPVPVAAAPRPMPVAAPAPVAVAAPVTVAVAGNGAGPRTTSPAASIESEHAATAAAPVSKPTAQAVAARRRGSKQLMTALIAMTVLAIGTFVASGYLGSSSDPQTTVRSLRMSLDEATDLQRRGEYEKAAALYEKIAATPGSGETGAKAARYLQDVKARMEDADRAFARLLADGMTLEPSEAQIRFNDLKARLGDGAAARHGDLVARIVADQRAWIDTHRKETEATASTLANDGHFARALEAWEKFRADGPQVDEARRAAEDGRAAVAVAASAALKDVVGLATSKEASEGPLAAAELLRSRVADFAGTPAAAAIEARVADYERESVSADTASSSRPSATPRGPRPTAHPGTPPGTSPTGTPPSLPPTERARLDGILSDAEAKAAGRQFAAALAALDEGLTVAPKGSPEAARVGARRDDMALARDGLDLLGKTVREHPDRFLGFAMTDRFTLDLVDADAEYLIGEVHGERTKYRWAAIEAARIALLVDRSRLAGKESLPLAGLLQAIGAKDAAAKSVLRVIEDGGDAAAASAALARWRGEPVPSGGYSVYEGRLVSPAERDRLVLAARIMQGIAKVGDKNPAIRKAAIADLLSLGKPAQEALSDALHARRTAVIQEFASMKVFTAGKTRQKLTVELEKRRATALALIENAAAYPYPSANHQGQEEVDRLVDLVKEVWFHPFDLIASWDDNVAKQMAAVAEVDEVLAKVEEGYRPDMAVVKTAADKAVDMPGHLLDEYSKKVLAYNEKVTTSATHEERDNVLAVNEYRIMMGREAVKIDERLVRAARGHSIEMVKLDYFAHEWTTPGLETPGKRCAREGYSSGVGENIASGAGTGRDAFELWFHSSGHHRNMISRGWTEMGCGRSHVSMWTQNFGGMTGNNLKDPDPLPPLRPEISPEPDDGEKAQPGTPPKKGRGRVPDKPPPGPPPDKPPDKPSDPPPDKPPSDPGSGMDSNGG